MVAASTAAWSSGVAAQTQRTAQNTVYLELGGNALLYSVSYERILPSNVALRAGAGYMSVSATAGSASSSVSSLGIPVTASYLGLGNLELGGGVLFQRFSGATSTGFGDDIEAGVFVPMATFIAAWRIVPPTGGFNFKLGFTPMYHPDIGFFPWGSVAFGVGF